MAILDRLSRRVMSNGTRLLLPLLLVFLILVSSCPAEALKQTCHYATSTSTARAPAVSFGTGNSGSSSISSTNDYASITTTAGLTLNETASTTSTAITAPSTDGTANAFYTSQTSGSVTFATSVNLDVIYIAVAIKGSNPVTTVTGGGLTFAQRASINKGTNVRIETWYALQTTSSSQTYTVNFGSSATFNILGFGIKNANYPNCFEQHSSVPATGMGTGTTQSVSLSTTYNNVLVIGAVAINVTSGNTSPNPTAGSGFTNIQSAHTTNFGYATERLALTAAVSSYSVSFTTGVMTVDWAMVGDVIWGKSPTTSTVNTGFTNPAANSNTIAAGRVGFLVSPAYPRATTIYSGILQLNLWASGTAGQYMDAYLIVTDSSFNIISTVFASVGSVGSFTAGKTLLALTYSISQVNIPSGGHLIVILSNYVSGAATKTVYWGSGQMTNFRTPQVFDYVLRIVNSASNSFSIRFATNSYSSIDRLVNFTLYVYSPTSTCIVITNGAFTQSSSSVLSLSGSSTFYVAINATASDFNSISNLVLLLKFAPTTKPFTNDGISLMVN